MPKEVLHNESEKIKWNTVLLIITIALFFVMYAVGCVIYSNKGFTHLQTFLNHHYQ